jgi:signal peptidase I
MGLNAPDAVPSKLNSTPPPPRDPNSGKSKGLKGRKATLKEELKSLAWIILVVLCIRAFIVEPYKIPTASMVPSLLVGDHIFVLKFAYSLGIPFTKIKLIQTGPLKRGDVAVFLYPEDESVNFVKRVIALAGDTVEIKNRMVYINDVPLRLEEIEQPQLMQEVLTSHKNPFQRLHHEQFPDNVSGFDSRNTHSAKHFVLLDDMNRNPLTQHFEKTTVPEGHFFVMGDNRDRSLDSRNWGFVPMENLKGRASVIWWSVQPDVPWLDVTHKFRWKRLFTWVK